MATLTKIDLERLAFTICEMDREVKSKQKLLEELKKEIYPYINPGEFISCEKGTVTKSKVGRDSFKFLSKQAERDFNSFKDGLCARGEAQIVPGDPFLIVTKGVNGV